jgi:uncharacterized RDD family membrane protein YckC
MLNQNTTVETNLILASKKVRWAAIFIDYLIYFFIFYLMGKYFGEATISDGNFQIHITGFPALVCFAMWFVLFPIIEGKNGQTIGKMIFNIKVINENGNPIFFKEALVRHLFDLVDFFPFLGIVGIFVASSNNSKQRVGDLVAKTIVVKK